MEATKKYKKIVKEKNKNKKREGAHYYSFLRDPHYYFILITLYSIEIIIHAYNYVGTLHTIELGLYIPMKSLLKRALGLLEQSSWMHPHYFPWRAFSSHVHPLHGNPYSSHHIYHMAFSPMIVLIDVSLSHLFCLPPPPSFCFAV